jgi:hypothetical protein
MTFSLVRSGLFLGCAALVEVTGVSQARAESSTKVEGFELLGGVGYSLAVEEGERRFGEPIDPANFVFLRGDFGYTFRFNLRLGATLGFGLEEGAVLTPLGASVGYDWLLGSFRLRPFFEGGFLFYWAGGDDILPSPYAGPGAALLWQHRAFEIGPSAKFMFAGPRRVELALMAGARF